jgi:ubiquinone/menaquinone biosynthesis C-methylase UbiE
MPSQGDPAGFVKVDQTSDPRYFIEFLDARKTIEGEREIKELVLDLLALRLGAHVLDIGCGSGDDAREIAGLVGASGRVVGIDASETMIAEARRRAAGCTLPLEFRTGDVRKLDFPDSSFDAVRTDRVLMFVSEIEQALSEIFRVLRQGGRLVTSEIDSETHLVDSPMAETSREVFTAYAQTFPHSRLGRQLLRLVTQTGFGNVKSVPRVVSLPYKMFRRLVDGFLRSSIENGRLAQADVSRWLEGLEQAETSDVFSHCLTIFTVCGQKL